MTIMPDAVPDATDPADPADPAETAPSKPYDLMLFGATGFTGALVAEYLAEHVPSAARWALAGRSEAKLAAVRDRLAARHPRLKDLPIVLADAADRAALRGLADSARVVISTVGPYLHHGEP